MSVAPEPTVRWLQVSPKKTAVEEEVEVAAERATGTPKLQFSAAHEQYANTFRARSQGMGS